MQKISPEVLRGLSAVHCPPHRKSLQSLCYRKGWDLSTREDQSQPAEVRTAVAVKIVTKVKAKAVQEKFRSAAPIVDEVSVLTLR